MLLLLPIGALTPALCPMATLPSPVELEDSAYSPMAVLLLPMLFLPFWGGVWARLGPSEIYGTLALGLMLFGIYHLVQAPDEAREEFRRESRIATT